MAKVLGFYVCPLNETISVALQELAFKAGYHWQGESPFIPKIPKNTDKRYLCFNINAKEISYCNDLSATANYGVFTIDSAVIHLEQQYHTVTLEFKVPTNQVVRAKQLVLNAAEAVLQNYEFSYQGLKVESKFVPVRPGSPETEIHMKGNATWRNPIEEEDDLQ